jgi:hypothetical protein
VLLTLCAGQFLMALDSSVIGEPLSTPSLIERGLNGGLLMFFFQFVVMMGLFFVVPLFLSVALGLSAIETGLRITPLSVTMLLAAAGVPKLLPTTSPRRIVTIGFVAVLVGVVALLSAMYADASATIVTVPMLINRAGSGSPRVAARQRYRLGGARGAGARGRRPSRTPPRSSAPRWGPPLPGRS